MPENPNMLMGFIVGNNATVAVQQDKNKLKDLLFDILKTTYPSFKFPNPVQLIM
jgi:hypothetical protein